MSCTAKRPSPSVERQLSESVSMEICQLSRAVAQAAVVQLRVSLSAAARRHTWRGAVVRPAQHPPTIRTKRKCSLSGCASESDRRLSDVSAFNRLFTLISPRQLKRQLCPDSREARHLLRSDK